MGKLTVRLLLGMLAAGAMTVTGPVLKAHTDTYGDMFAAVDGLAHKYGVHVYTDHRLMEYGTYAITTSGDVIIFNSGYIADPALLRRDVTSDVRSGWHRGANCTPEQEVATHEFAHVLDNLSGHTTDTELAAAIANGLDGEVSGYSMTSYDEAIAEAFVAVECDVPTPVESAIYTMLTT